MPCSTASSDGVALSLVTEGQSHYRVSGEVWLGPAGSGGAGTWFGTGLPASRSRKIRRGTPATVAGKPMGQ
jgi:hypothetical protein